MTSKVKPAKKVVGVRDVARLAGCSVGTVSNVINRPDQVRPDSRARVEKAIEELQYVGSRSPASFGADEACSLES